MLTARREAVLKAIVSDYISKATPIGSQEIARRQNLGVSPATIRIDMAGLEEQGYITRPHTSAGGVPSDKGYRHYVERLADKTDLAPAQRTMIWAQLHQVYPNMEEWAHLAAAVLPKITDNLAIITLPKATQVKLKRLELVSVQELIIMLILILQGTKIIRHMFATDEPISQDELTSGSNKLNHIFQGVAATGITVTGVELTPLERRLMDLAKELMRAEEDKSYEEPYLEGLHELFNQPEFSSTEILRDFVEILEERDYLRRIMEQIYSGPGVQVAIGGEFKDSSMRHFSLVITEYGVEGHARGVVGVLGPKRMEYSRNISTVHYLSELMNEVTEEVYR